MFRGLINFTSELDSILYQHLQNATVFKGTSKTIQNDLLDVMLSVLHEEIKNEIKKAVFLAVMSDDTTDVTNESQNVVVFRYVMDEKVYERFWTFTKLPQGDAETIASSVSDCLKEVIPDKKRLW